MKISFKNRIALYYMVATALIMAVFFGIVYLIVQGTVYQNLDRDLTFEAEKHTDEIEIIGDSIHFINRSEWEEREHREIQVNPVFLQVIDPQGRVMDKSPNLKENTLPFRKDENESVFFDDFLDERAIRQTQIPIVQAGEIRGYILAAMSSTSSELVIRNLRKVLLFSYLFLLAALYFISRYLAGRSILPIIQITQTTRRISQTNLQERVELPPREDELHELSTAINGLLQRIENAIERERQFTSDASHELRTPLSALRGTLEVLIRKARSQAEYEEKIRYSLSEIDRLSSTLEQLLLLARLDSQAESNGDAIALSELLEEVMARYTDEMDSKRLVFHPHIQLSTQDRVPHYHASLVLDNLIQNAIKYSRENSAIHIHAFREGQHLICTIKDTGIGIAAGDLGKIFDPFFRSEALNHKEIPGNGLGLSIAKKSADAIHAQLSVDSQLGKGTSFNITF